MKKILILILVLASAYAVYWFANDVRQSQPDPGQTDNYFDDGYVPGVFKAYDGSKEKINSAVEKENNKIQDAMNQSGL